MTGQCYDASKQESFNSRSEGNRGTAQRLRVADLPFIVSLLHDPKVLEQTKFRILPELIDQDALKRWAFSPQLHRFIFSCDDKPIGLIVLEPAHEGQVKLSYLLHSSMRGHGWGKALAREGAVLARSMGFRRIYAEATTDNVASLRIIEQTLFGREFIYREKKLSLELDPMTQNLALTTADGTKLEALPISASDLPFYRVLFSDPAIRDQVYCAFDFDIASDENLLAFLLGTSVQRWTICAHRGGRQPAGTMHIYEQDGAFANFGICLAADYRGLGYGDSVLALVEKAARQLGIRILRGDIFLNNTAMIRLAERRGFKPFRYFEKYLFTPSS
jgi:RimJ/RimL family protein N-acetyltransferase